MAGSDKPDGIFARLAVYGAIVLVCAVLVGGLAALYYVFLPTGRTRSGRRYKTKLMLEDTGASMAQRFYVGAGVGAVLGVGASVALHRKMGGMG